MLRCGLAFAWSSVVGSAIAMDCLYGLPKRGRITTNLVGCNNPKVVYEESVVRVAGELIAHDVLALTNGCAAFALLKMGSCLPEGLAGAGPGLNAVLRPLGLPPVWHMGECLDNAVDLSIDAGEFLCLVGPSGCGKTTLIQLMPTNTPTNSRAA